MKLHWSPRSPFVRKVMVVAHEKRLVDKLECIRTVAITDRPSPVLMADNPLNKLPTLMLNDGTVIYDSRVICEYLDALDGAPSLFPGGELRWDALCRQALGDGLLDLLIAWRHERNRPESQQAKSYIDAYRLKAFATFDRMDQQIASRAGFDIGDVAFGCALAYVDFRFQDVAWRDGREGLATWFDKTMARESFGLTPVVNDGEAV